MIRFYVSCDGTRIVRNTFFLGFGVEMPSFSAKFARVFSSW